MFFDTDCGGVVHNLAYLRMIETNRTRLAAVLGLDLRGMYGTKLFPVVVRTEIDYRRPALLGDWVRIDGELEGLEGAQVHRSWWAARDAVRDVSRGDGRAVLTLEGDLKVPVSRVHARRLRAEGWW